MAGASGAASVLLVFADIINSLLKEFLYYALSSQYIYNSFSLVAAGSTVKNLKADTVKQGKTVVFTAEPAGSSCEVEQWTNKGTVIAEAGTNTTYNHRVTADANIAYRRFLARNFEKLLAAKKINKPSRVSTGS